MSLTAPSNLPPESEDSLSTRKPQSDFCLRQKVQADPRPCDSDPASILYHTKGYTMKLRAGTKKVTLFRFLLAKLVYGREHEGLSLEEFLCFHELYLELVDSKDPLLLAKWASSFEKCSKIMAATAKFVEFPLCLDELSREKVISFMGEDPMLPSPSAFYGLMGNRDLRSAFRVQFRSQWIPPKRVERYIGVGYKDKGTRRNPALDGSPSWQTVAATLSNREREAEEAEMASPSLQTEEGPG